MTYFMPKVIIDCTNKYDELSRDIEHFLSGSGLHKYVKLYKYDKVKQLNNGDITREISRLPQENPDISILNPTSKNRTYICIILMGKDESNNKMDILNEIKSKTDPIPGNNAGWIVIHKDAINSASSLFFSQIKVTDQLQTTEKISDERYNIIIQNIIKTLIILNLTEITDTIFQHNILNPITINADIISIPSIEVRDSAIEFFMKNVFKILTSDINEQDKGVSKQDKQESSNTRDSENTTNSERNQQNEENKQGIKISRFEPDEFSLSLFSSKSQRNQIIKEYIDRQQRRRGDTLDKREKIKFGDSPRDFDIEYESALTEINDEIKKKIQNGYRIKEIKESLEKRKKDIETKIKANKENQNWIFIKKYYPIEVSGFPFNLLSLFLSILYFAVGTGLYVYFDLSKEFNEYFPEILISSYFIVWILISLIYTRNKSSEVRKEVDDLVNNYEHFQRKNIKNFLIAGDIYLNKLILEKINLEFNRFVSICEAIDENYKNFMTDENFFQSIPEDQREIASTIIRNHITDENISDIIKRTTEDNLNDILSFIDDINFFEQLIRNNFISDKLYNNIINDIRDALIQGNKIDILNYFNGIDALPIPGSSTHRISGQKILIISRASEGFINQYQASIVNDPNKTAKFIAIKNSIASGNDPLDLLDNCIILLNIGVI